MEIQWESFATSAVSATVITAMAKSYIQKSFRELEDVVQKISSVREQIAVLSIKLENAEKTSHLLHDHDRKIAAMEQVVYGQHRQNSGKNSHPEHRA